VFALGKGIGEGDGDDANGTPISSTFQNIYPCYYLMKLNCLIPPGL